MRKESARYPSRPRGCDRIGVQGISNGVKEGYEIACERIAREAEARTGFLDLGRLGLNSFPPALFELRHIRDLCLGENYWRGDEVCDAKSDLGRNSGSTMLRELQQHGMLSNMHALWLDGIGLVQEDVGILSMAGELRMLDLCGNRGISELAPVGSLQNLRLLDCSATQVADLTPLGTLTSLATLRCSGTPVADLTPLGTLTSLATLRCSGTPVADLTPLGTLTSLATLRCSGTPVADLTPLGTLTSLATLRCSGTPVADLTPLRTLRSLATLDCSNTPVADLTPLGTLTSLATLNCSFTPVADLTPLGTLTSLATLDCSCTPVADLTPLGTLTSLATLRCSGTPVADLTPLRTLRSLATLDCSNTPVADLTPLGTLTSLATLNCSFTPVADLTPLGTLTSLATLDCSCTPVADLTPLGTLTSLATLNCTHTQVADLTPLGTLTSLATLDCSHTQIANLTPLGTLTSLATLDCSGTQVADLTPLGTLTSLASLNCSHTPVADLTPLGTLTSLATLHCFHTQVADLSPLGTLTSLASLNCSHTPVADLKPLGMLTSLATLHCSGTQVADLTPLGTLTSLATLHCSGTQVADLTPLRALASLTALDCSRTQVTDLRVVGDLPALRDLRINYLRLNSPLVFHSLRNLNALRSFETRIPDVPAEVLSANQYSDCLESVTSHLQDLEAGAAQAFDEIKVIVLGNGRVGKTQLCRKLRGLEYDDSISSTHGVDIDRATFDGGVTLNLWDFGGQDIYHSTHSLFLRSSAVFLIAWTPEHERDGQTEYDGLLFRNFTLPYWIEYVKHSAGKPRCAVVVQTQCEAAGDAQYLPLTKTQVEGFDYLENVAFGASNDFNLTILREYIRQAIDVSRAGMGAPRIGYGRAAVLQHLRDLQKQDADRPSDEKRHRTLTYAQFETICVEAGGVSSARELLGYLHNLGAVFYQHKLFNNQIVLDQTWALEGIYTVFDRESCFRQLRYARGRFTRSLLESLVWREYPEEEQQLFLHLMQSCGICFEHRSSSHDGNVEASYIAPDLLPDFEDVAAELAGRWLSDHDKTVSVDYELGFLHHGIIRTLISKVGELAGETGVYWRSGVWFFDTNTGSSAVLEQPTDRACIRIRCQGHARESLLIRIHHWLEDRGINGRADRMVFDGRVLTNAESEKLLDRSERKVGAREKDLSRESDAVTVEQQIKVTPGDSIPSHSNAVFISYKRTSEIGIDALPTNVDQLRAQLRDADIQVIIDVDDLQTGDRISDFMRRLAAGRQVVIVLSDAYLRSPSCMYELYHIYRNTEGKADHFLQRILPVVMPDVEIDKLTDRLRYATYWKEEKDAIDSAMQALGPENYTPEDLREFQMIGEFCANVSGILGVVKDKLMPRSFDVASGRGFQDIIELVLKEYANDPPGRS